MTIDKATGILAAYLLAYHSRSQGEIGDAIKLSIEALKWLSIWRSGEYVNWRGLLPGETK